MSGHKILIYLKIVALVFFYQLMFVNVPQSVRNYYKFRLFVQLLRPFQVISLFLIKMRVGFWPDFQKKQTKLYIIFRPFSSNWNIETNKNHVDHLSFDGKDS